MAQNVHSFGGTVPPVSNPAGRLGTEAELLRAIRYCASRARTHTPPEALAEYASAAEDFTRALRELRESR